MPSSILFVDDDPGMCDLVCDALGKHDLQVKAVTSSEEALLAVEKHHFDVVVTDLQMDGMSGLELCRRLGETHPDIPVIVVTAFGSLDVAIEAIRTGVHDFITKPFQIESLAVTIHRAMRLGTLRGEVRKLRDETASAPSFDDAVGASEAVRGVFDLIERVADSDTTVLVTGESGTGKELVARALHRHGRRHTGPFVAINCAALPETLLESELFGHVRGAFTDAKTAKPGLFSDANGGTLFLDEIGDMPLGMQVKLLRALQERSVRPIGGQREVPFDVRIVAATNRDLELDIAERRFREDLYYRINVVQIRVPPLRARGHDVLLIAQHVLNQCAKRSQRKVLGFSLGAAEKLLSYSWPGNVRELQNCIERAVALTKLDQIVVEDLPEQIRAHRSTPPVEASANVSEPLTMAEVERRHILQVVHSVSGNKSLAARLLRLDRRTLYRKLAEYGEAAE